MERLGVPFDAVAGQCRTADAKQFHERRFGRIRFSRFNYSVYGPDIPGILARAWAHRMQFFFNSELGHPDCQALVCTPEFVATYKEASEMTRLAEAQAGKPAVMARIEQIRRIQLQY